MSLEYDFRYSSTSVVGSNGVTGEAVATSVLPMASALARWREATAGPTFLDAFALDRRAIEDQATLDIAAFTDLIVVGIGGSSLGARAIYDAIVRPRTGTWRDGSPRRGLRLHFIENVDPVEFQDVLETVDLRTTAVNVITKSGATIETMGVFLAIRERLLSAFGPEGYRARVRATTDPTRGALRQLVSDDRLVSFEVPEHVGGRYSVFTPVGLYPLAAAGLDLAGLLDGVTAARDSALSPDPGRNVSATFARVQMSLYRAGVHDVVFMPYVSGLRALAEWFVQLWAESLGKTLGGEGRGPTPLVAVGATDQHSQLQLFMEGPATKNIVFVRLAEDDFDVVVPEIPSSLTELAHLGGKGLCLVRESERRGVELALAEARRPSSVLTLDRLDARALGSTMMTLMCATAMAGADLGVNAFDQPGVERAKIVAHELLGRTSGQRASGTPVAVPLGREYAARV